MTTHNHAPTLAELEPAIAKAWQESEELKVLAYLVNETLTYGTAPDFEGLVCTAAPAVSLLLRNLESLHRDLKAMHERITSPWITSPCLVGGDA